MELPDAYKTGTIFGGATQEPDDFTNFTELEDDMEPQEDVLPGGTAADKAALELATQLRARESLDKEDPVAPPGPVPAEYSRKDVPDKQQLLDLCTSDAVLPIPAAKGDPSTLKGVLEQATRRLGHVPTEFAHIATELWQLLRHLRAFPHGCDAMHVKHCKQKTRKLNWHQWMEREAALLKECPNTRTGRLASWRYLAQKAAGTLSTEVPETIDSGDCILVQSPATDCWVPAVVLTVWRNASKQIRPSPRQLPISSLRGLRCVELACVGDNTYECGAFSPCFKVPLECICCVLAIKKYDASHHRFRVTLTTPAARAVTTSSKAPVFPERFLKCSATADVVEQPVPPAPCKKSNAKRPVKEEIPARAENFTRFQAGHKLIRQELTKLRDLEDKLFTEDPSFDASDVCTQGSTQLSWSHVLEYAPEYFSRHFSQFRGKTFGNAMWAWMDRAAREMKTGKRMVPQQQIGVTLRDLNATCARSGSLQDLSP